MDLNYSTFLQIWTHHNRLFKEGKSKIASYMFTGCSVEGTVTINGNAHNVKGNWSL